MNYRRILHVLARLLMTISLTMFAPMGVALIYTEWWAAAAFLISITTGLAAALAARYAGRQAPSAFYRREGLAVVATAWIVCSFVACLPYMITGVIPGFVDAFFESMSGFTTTGASVLRTVEFMADGTAVPRSILFWRCMTNWLGGVGIVVLFVALLPALGVGGRLLFHFESPGVGEKGFMPHIRQTASMLWIIYVTLTGLEAILLWIAGMDLFHAICHSFATLATGGFSPHTASVGHYSSTAIHVIVTIFMLLAACNFTLYFKAVERRWKDVWEDRELRFFICLVAVAILLVWGNLVWSGQDDSAAHALRDSAFQVASISTTTGFATADFDAWPSFSRLILVLLMFVGGCAGSTAGGMKCIRIAVVFKFMMRQLKSHVRPRNVDQIRMGSDPIPVEVYRPVLGMFLIFVCSFAFGALALAAMGLDLTTAMSASIATLGNIGPGLGSVGPTANYADLPAAGKLMLTLFMLVGRLEIYTALSLFTPTLWRD